MVKEETQKWQIQAYFMALKYLPVFYGRSSLRKWIAAKVKVIAFTMVIRYARLLLYYSITLNYNSSFFSTI